MTAVRLTTPADGFATTPFWRRLTAVAAEQGHDRDHGLQLVGHVDPDNLYTLRCVRCDLAVVELTVDRS
ncbi:hypothetical protein [Micromonospora wenchangensis]|uniref:hypothetical protein n=1 Tax=Micromonospora wenchangensis TaxID=1185415 RepID=UPI0037F42E53